MRAKGSSHATGASTKKRSPAAGEKVTPAREGRAELRERASRFFAYAVPAGTAKQAAAAVTRVTREHHDATHVAFAWKIGAGDSPRSRCSDAGEPAGTAGPPILRAVESEGVTDVAVAVARDFGGRRLGKAGLAGAYGDVAKGALEDAGRVARYETVEVVVSCPPDRSGALRRLLDPPAIRVGEERWEETNGRLRSAIHVRRSQLDGFLAALEEAGFPYEAPER
ncbi:MAG: YigZ family protein [Thermoanaerobaculia bacterium]